MCKIMMKSFIMPRLCTTRVAVCTNLQLKDAYKVVSGGLENVAAV